MHSEAGYTEHHTTEAVGIRRWRGNLQQCQRDVAVDLGLELHLNVEVQLEPQLQPVLVHGVLLAVAGVARARGQRLVRVHGPRRNLAALRLGVRDGPVHARLVGPDPLERLHARLLHLLLRLEVLEGPLREAVLLGRRRALRLRAALVVLVLSLRAGALRGLVLGHRRHALLLALAGVLLLAAPGAAGLGARARAVARVGLGVGEIGVLGGGRHGGGGEEKGARLSTREAVAIKRFRRSRRNGMSMPHAQKKQTANAESKKS